MRDFSADHRWLSINTATVRAQWPLDRIIDECARRGIRAISPWRDQVAAVGLDKVAKALRDTGIELSGYCRGGMFPASNAEGLQAALDDNRRAVDEAKSLNAACLVLVVGALPGALAFALSWPWLSDYGFVGSYVVGAAALYFHLLAVEPARHRGLRWAAAACAVVGVALTLWFNVQRTDQFGEELYMNHLFPPALRLVGPVANDAFIDDLARLKPLLDKKALEKSGTDEAGDKGEADE